MTKQELAATLRQEVGELEVLIEKLQTRCSRMKKIVLTLESETSAPAAQGPVEDSKFRKVVDRIFGEEPKRRNR